MTLTEDNQRVGFRVSIVPTIDGEKVVMRLLEEGNSTFSMDGIGFCDTDRGKVEQMLDKPHGMMVVTRSHRVWQVNHDVRDADKPESNRTQLVTGEDPVEYRLQGIYQVQSTMTSEWDSPTR